MMEISMWKLGSSVAFIFVPNKFQILYGVVDIEFIVKLGVKFQKRRST